MLQVRERQVGRKMFDHHHFLKRKNFDHFCSTKHWLHLLLLFFLSRCCCCCWVEIVFTSLSLFSRWWPSLTSSCNSNYTIQLQFCVRSRVWFIFSQASLVGIFLLPKLAVVILPKITLSLQSMTLLRHEWIKARHPNLSGLHAWLT